MGKRPAPSRLRPDEARAMARAVKVSPQKLNLVAGLIRGRPVGEAARILEFSRRRIAADVRKVLLSAVANAEAVELNANQLVVAEASVGKSLVMRRFRARARGRMGRYRRAFSRLTIIVRETE